jgi:hypothetical protein
MIGLLSVLLVAGVLLVIITLFREDVPAPATTTTAIAGGTTSTTSASTETTVGANTTTAETPTTAPTSTTLADPFAALAMSEAGLGDVGFGTLADDAIFELGLILGEPTEDTGWTPEFQTCPGPEARIVRWTSLQAYFTDGATEWAAQGTPHFFHFGNSVNAGGGEVLDLRTSQGIAVGDTLGALKAAYGDRVTVSDDPLFGPLWEVQVDGAGALWGTAGTADDEGRIDSINGGPGCGE